MRCTLATLTIVACTAAATVRGADPDLSLLQQRIDRLDALLQRIEASPQSSSIAKGFARSS